MTLRQHLTQEEKGAILEYQGPHSDGWIDLPTSEKDQDRAWGDLRSVLGKDQVKGQNIGGWDGFWEFKGGV